MKKTILLGFLLSAGLAFASFEDMGFGTRGMGMGPGFVSLADDVSAVYYNPAGLSQVSGNQLLLSYSKLYWGLGSGNTVDEDNSIYSLSAGFCRDLGLFHMGIGYYRFGASSYYSENMVIVSGAREFTRIHLRAGLSLKLLNNNFGSDIYTSVNPVFANGSDVYGFGLDLGAIYRLKDFSLGLSLVNLYSTDMGLASEDRLPVRVNVGLSYLVPETASFLSSRKVVPTLGLQVEGQNVHLGLGGEIWFFQARQLGCRFSFQWGNYSYSVLALGLTYQRSLTEKASIAFDYGFDYPISSIKGTYGTHRVAMNLGF